jgi:hypothetical protein
MERKRQINYKKAVLLDSDSPRTKKHLEAASTPKMLNTILDTEGLPRVSRQSAQAHVRSKEVATPERILVENHFLPQFLEQCRKTDPDGLYEMLTDYVEYCGQSFVALRQWIVSFGSCKKLLAETDVLLVLSFDGAHMKTIFGGVLYVAVIPSANRNIIPIMVGCAPSEDAESSKYFTAALNRQFPGIPFVWMNDQGGGIVSEVNWSFLFIFFYFFL